MIEILLQLNQHDSSMVDIFTKSTAAMGGYYAWGMVHIDLFDDADGNGINSQLIESVNEPVKAIIQLVPEEDTE